MKMVYMIAALFAARFLVTAIGYPPGDGDLAWQRWLGAAIATGHGLPHAIGAETFTAAGAPWVPQEWAFSLAVYWSQAHALFGVFCALIALCAVATLALVGYRALRCGGSPTLAAVVTALTGIAMLQSFGVRVQVVGWLFLAVVLVLIELEGPWMWASLIVTALWSNVHASVMLAPMIALAALVAAVLEERRWSLRVRRQLLLLTGMALAVCVNPLGWHLPAYALTLVGSPIKHAISEWRPTDVSDWSFTLGALPIVLVLAAGGLRSLPRRWHDALLCTMAFALMLFAARNIAVFAIVAAPVAAGAIARLGWLPSRAQETPLEQNVGRTIAVLAAAVAIVIGVSLLRSAPTRAASAPLQTLAAVLALPGEHRVLCEDFAWCSYLLDRPRTAIFIDGRADPFPLEVWNDYLGIIKLHPEWRGRLRSRDVNVVVAHVDSALGQAMALLPGWHEVKRDAGFIAYGRTAAPPR